MEYLNGLKRKVLRYKTTAADCELIDHYLTSIGLTGFLQRILTESGVLSFDDIKDALVADPDIVDFTPFEITLKLRLCIANLKRHVAAGEKIY
jgi:hypothetical protein